MEEEQSKVIEIKRTKAEIAFQKMQEKMVSNYLIDSLILSDKVIEYNSTILLAAN